jgi:hypothetical protein
MNWVTYLKFLSIGKFVLIEYLTFNYIFAYFWNDIWLFYQLIIHSCSEAIFRKNILSTNFPPVSDFQCEASGRIYSYVRIVKCHVRARTVLPIANLAMHRSDECVPSPNAILTGTFLPLPFSASHIPLNFFFNWFIMTCCVFFSRNSPKILAFSVHLFSFHDLPCVFLCSFKFLCF